MFGRSATVLIFLIITLLITIFSQNKNISTINVVKSPPEVKITGSNPLSIAALRERNYDGGKIAIVKELDPGTNYKRYIASYKSDGLKIYGLLTIPTQQKPEKGFPSIVFDHGYIRPEEYQTTERYIAYVDNLARAGYVVYKIDFRGNGDSEGKPYGAYFSLDYTIDTINAAEALKKLSYVNPRKIGVWGHSMAGMIISRALVAKPDEFAAAVIWGGAVGSYEDLFREWWSKRRPRSFTPSARELASNRPSRDTFVNKYGQPNNTSAFWKEISPTTYISSIQAPIQLDHGEADEEVPVELSRIFYKILIGNGKTAELYTYPGADHNISSPSFELAMQRTIEFFDKYLK